MIFEPTKFKNIIWVT